MFGVSSKFDCPTVTLLMKYQSLVMGRGLLTVRGTNRAFFASGARNMMGSCEESIHPLLQSILGYVAANHEYPKMALFSPRFVKKKRRGLLVVSV